jgi:1-acyl-sn-glycerol-3-phosphate acyltransferase
MGMSRFAEGLARTVIQVTLMFPVMIVCCSAALIHHAFGGSNSDVHWAYRRFSEAWVRIAGATLLVRGAEHIDPRRAYIVVSNHESNLDPFALMHALPQLVIRFVIKRQLMKVPLFGQTLARTGNVTVARSQTRADVRRIQEVMSHRDPTVSLLFFAEGTRAKDGRLQPFKKGAFATALNEGVPILPVGLAGSFFVLRPGSLWLRRGGIAIEVGEPISVEGRDPHDRDALCKETFDRVAGLRSRARERLRESGFEPGGHDA